MSQTENGPPPFTQLMLKQRKGLLHEELTDAVSELVAAVMKHGKKGSLTLKLTVAPHGDDGITIADTYSLKAPTPPAKPSIYFADEHGRFSRDRLDQPELPLREVKTPTGAATIEPPKENAS